jgi:hypothetical protein
MVCPAFPGVKQLSPAAISKNYIFRLPVCAVHSMLPHCWTGVDYDYGVFARIK